MTQHQQSPPTDVFDAAKLIVETLKGLDQQKQVQAIRFASEALGLSGLSTVQSPSVAASQTPKAEPIHSMDIRQFTDLKAPKSDQQFAAVVAYFYRFEAPETQRKESIDAATLQEAARLANRNRPPRPGMTLNNAKNAGYLDSDSSGKFTISTVGENLVAVTLPGNTGETAAQRGARRTTKKKTQPTKNKKPPKPRK
jgi:hypothetical protein